MKHALTQLKFNSRSGNRISLWSLMRTATTTTTVTQKAYPESLFPIRRSRRHRHFSETIPIAGFAAWSRDEGDKADWLDRSGRWALASAIAREMRRKKV